MATMSKKQYELLIEALGEALADARTYNATASTTVEHTVDTLSKYLSQDNHNFREQEFKDRIKAVADLDDVLEDLTINL